MVSEAVIALLHIRLPEVQEANIALICNIPLSPSLTPSTALLKNMTRFAKYS